MNIQKRVTVHLLAFEQELLLAWEKEGKKHFNICHKCGKFVINAVYNPEGAECVECAPFEAEAKFCKTCGAKVEPPEEPVLCVATC